VPARLWGQRQIIFSHGSKSQLKRLIFFNVELSATLAFHRRPRTEAWIPPQAGEEISPVDRRDVYSKSRRKIIAGRPNRCELTQKARVAHYSPPWDKTENATSQFFCQTCGNSRTNRIKAVASKLHDQRCFVTVASFFCFWHKTKFMRQLTVVLSGAWCMWALAVGPGVAGPGPCSRHSNCWCFGGRHWRSAGNNNCIVRGNTRSSFCFARLFCPKKCPSSLARRREQGDKP